MQIESMNIKIVLIYYEAKVEKKYKVDRYLVYLV